MSSLQNASHKQRVRLQANTDWITDALCRVAEIPTEIFYEDHVTARTICDECAVAFQCRQYAFITNETFGIWGGVNFGDWSHTRANRADKTDPRIREAYRKVWRRYEPGSQGRKALRRLSDSELELLAAQEDYI